VGPKSADFDSCRYTRTVGSRTRCATKKTGSPRRGFDSRNEDVVGRRIRDASGPFPPQSSENIAFASPWLHFLEGSHSSGRGFPVGFRRGAHCSAGNFILQLRGPHCRSAWRKKSDITWTDMRNSLMRTRPTSSARHSSCCSRRTMSSSAGRANTPTTTCKNNKSKENLLQRPSNKYENPSNTIR